MLWTWASPHHRQAPDGFGLFGLHAVNSPKGSVLRLLSLLETHGASLPQPVYVKFATCDLCETPQQKMGGVQRQVSVSPSPPRFGRAGFARPD